MRPELDCGGWIVLDDLLVEHLAREAADAREMAPLARHRHLATAHRFQIAADDTRLKRRGFDLMIAAVLLEVAEVARVGLHRVVAEPAFDPQAVEMALDYLVPTAIPVLRDRARGAIRARKRPGAESSVHAFPFSAGTSSSRSTSAARKPRIASRSMIFPPLESLM